MLQRYETCSNHTSTKVLTQSGATRVTLSAFDSIVEELADVKGNIRGRSREGTTNVNHYLQHEPYNHEIDKVNLLVYTYRLAVFCQLYLCFCSFIRLYYHPD